jgi:mannose-6-phosphate isomerase-like protein (cupin superfamily)
MPRIAAADATHFNLEGTDFFSLVAPSSGARETAVWRVSVPVGKLSRVPHQLTREEILIALSGKALCSIGGERCEIAPGDAIIVPAFTDFSLDNPGDTPFEAITVFPVGGRAILADRPPFVPPWAA